MIIRKKCKCGYSGEVFLPEKSKATNTIITCPRCDNKEDIAYLYNISTLEEIERMEYERLKKKYG